MSTEVKLPEVGENITAGDVVKVLVSVGESIDVDQPLLELETDKASFEIPSPIAGTVKLIKVEEGTQAQVGSVIMLVDENGVASSSDSGADPADRPEAPAPEPASISDADSRADPTDRPGSPDREPVSISESPPPAPGPDKGIPVPAAPSVRMFARELGVDITQVKGSGVGGRISDADVKKHAKMLITTGGGAAPAGAPGMVRRPALPDFSAYGEIERETMSKVRRRTAEQMELSWSIPVVTQQDRADVTHLEELRKSWAKRAEKAGTKLTVTAIALKVAAAALKKFPQFNASIDMQSSEIIYKKYYHLGVAVDTDRGLLVPVIRDVDKKNILEISSELQALAEKARAKKIMPDEMQGASFTITNLGGIGGTAFTPIVNSPEVAILGLSRGTIEPVWKDGEFQPRMMLPLSLTYDHRIIDGADAARFLRWIAEALEEPLLLALEG